MTGGCSTYFDTRKWHADKTPMNSSNNAKRAQIFRECSLFLCGANAGAVAAALFFVSFSILFQLIR